MIKMKTIKGAENIYCEDKIASNMILTYLQDMKGYHTEEKVDLCSVALSSRTTNNMVAPGKNYFSSAHGDITCFVMLQLAKKKGTFIWVSLSYFEFIQHWFLHLL